MGGDVVFIYVEPCCAGLYHVATLCCVGVAKADVNLSQDLNKEFEYLSMNVCSCVKVCVLPLVL